jgi:hypothetical protein
MPHRFGVIRRIKQQPLLFATGLDALGLLGRRKKILRIAVPQSRR